MNEIPDEHLVGLYRKRLDGSVEVNRRLRESSSAASNRILELESLIRDLARHFQKIGNGAFSHDYVWITEQVNAALSEIPEELQP